MNDESESKPIFGGALVTLDADTSGLVAAMEDTADVGGRAGDVSYMSFSGKTGQYSIGVDQREPGEDEHWLVAATAFELGYICWKGNKPVSKRMASISQPRIPEPDPNEHGPFERDGEGWQRARAITMRSLENEEQVYFSINSKSGVASMADLQKDVLARMKSGQPFWPIVIMGKEKFESQGYKNIKPTFDIVSWASTDQVQALGEEGADPMALLGGEAGAPAETAPTPKRRKL